MSNLIIKKCRPLIKGKIQHSLHDIVIKNGKIAKIEPVATINEKIKTIDAEGMIVAPGYIDIHTHGANGYDCLENSQEALEVISSYHLKNGVTSYYPTLLTASIQDISLAIKNIKAYMDKNANSQVLGIHLEGVFLSPEKAGAHEIFLLMSPNAQNTWFLKANKNAVKRVTMAPDIENALFLVDLCRKKKIQVSLGHDNAYDEQIYAAIHNGATSITHLFNCTSSLSRIDGVKRLGINEIALLSDKLFVEVIADNKHVSKDLFALILKNKPNDKIILVSDTVAIAGNPKRESLLGIDPNNKLSIKDGVAYCDSLKTIAGSITPLNKMVASIKREFKISDERCIAYATSNPAKLMKLKNLGQIKKDYIANLNILDDSLNVVTTIFEGNIVN